jgi:hypothetical protein
MLLGFVGDRVGGVAAATTGMGMEWVSGRWYGGGQLPSPPNHRVEKVMREFPWRRRRIFGFFFGTYLIGQLCRVKYVDALWAVFFGCLVLGRDIGVSRSNQNLSFLSHIKAKVIGISSHYRHRHDARGGRMGS